MEPELKEEVDAGEEEKQEVLDEEDQTESDLSETGLDEQVTNELNAMFQQGWHHISYVLFYFVCLVKTL